MTALPRACPPDGFTLVDTWTLNGYEELSRLRAGVAEVIAVAAESPTSRSSTLTRDVVVVSSELATNALKHGGAPTSVALFANASGYMLDVADPDPAGLPALAHGRAPGEGGFGLRLAARLASRIGWFTTARAKHVWVTFSIDG